MKRYAQFLEGPLDSEHHEFDARDRGMGPIGVPGSPGAYELTTISHGTHYFSWRSKHGSAAQQHLDPSPSPTGL